jgi:hypothetical protein
VRAIAEHRYPQINKNHRNSSGIAPGKIWRDEIWHDPIPAKQKHRSNNRAPDRSRAA